MDKSDGLEVMDASLRNLTPRVSAELRKKFVALVAGTDVRLCASSNSPDDREPFLELIASIPVHPIVPSNYHLAPKLVPYTSTYVSWPRTRLCCMSVPIAEMGPESLARWEADPELAPLPYRRTIEGPVLRRWTDLRSLRTVVSAAAEAAAFSIRWDKEMWGNNYKTFVVIHPVIAGLDLASETVYFTWKCECYREEEEA